MRCPARRASSSRWPNGRPTRSRTPNAPRSRSSGATPRPKPSTPGTSTYSTQQISMCCRAFWRLCSLGGGTAKQQRATAAAEQEEQGGDGGRAAVVGLAAGPAAGPAAGSRAAERGRLREDLRACYHGLLPVFHQPHWTVDLFAGPIPQVLPEARERAAPALRHPAVLRRYAAPGYRHANSLILLHSSTLWGHCSGSRGGSRMALRIRRNALPSRNPSSLCAAQPTTAEALAAAILVGDAPVWQD